jgi:hypothetical protein
VWAEEAHISGLERSIPRNCPRLAAATADETKNGIGVATDAAFRD